MSIVRSENRVHLGYGVCGLIFNKTQIYHPIITFQESLSNSPQKRGVAAFFQKFSFA